MIIRTAVATHVERFNEGVRARDFTRMVENFTPDVTMTFRGVPVGPLAGPEAIVEAYREQPPRDQIDVLDLHPLDDQSARVRYAWKSDPGRAAGEMVLNCDPDGHISQLEIALF